MLRLATLRLNPLYSLLPFWRFSIKQIYSPELAHADSTQVTLKTLGHAKRDTAWMQWPFCYKGSHTLVKISQLYASNPLTAWVELARDMYDVFRPTGGRMGCSLSKRNWQTCLIVNLCLKVTLFGKWYSTPWRLFQILEIVTNDSDPK